MPNIDFNNTTELQSYVNNTLVDNNSQSIKADEHNNIESGLIKFINQSPKNWDKTRVTASQNGFLSDGNSALVVLEKSFLGTVNLKENKWNEWTILNMTSSNKQLSGNDITTYYSPSGVAKTYILKNSVLKLIKGQDGKWYETDNSVNSQIIVDQSVQQGSVEPVSSNAVFNALQDIQVDVEDIKNINNTYIY